MLINAQRRACSLRMARIRCKGFVQELPKLDEPWERTERPCAIFRRRKNRHGVISAHPDAQLSVDVALLELDGQDHKDQEALLKFWRLIRVAKYWSSAGSLGC